METEKQATGQIVFHQNPGNSHTYIRYSDDGGKTFTAAKDWEETRDYGAGVNLITNADAALSKLSFYQPSGTVTASTANNLKKFTVSPADVGKELVSPYTVTIPEDGTYTESLFVQTDYALTGARISFYTDGHHKVKCEVNKIYNGQYVISAKYELKAGDRLRLPDVDLFTDSATAGTYVSAGYPSLVKEGEHIKGRNLFDELLYKHITYVFGKYFDRLDSVTLENGVLTVTPPSEVGGSPWGYYNNKWNIGNYNNIPMGAEYVLSFYAKAGSPAKFKNQFEELAVDSGLTNKEIGTEWKRYSVRCRRIYGTWQCLDFCFEGQATVYFKDFMLTIGNDIYPYAPAPEDQQFGLTPGKYLGVAVSEKPYPPMNVEDYSWSEIKGTDGKGIASVVRYFGLSNSESTQPTSFDTTPKTPTSSMRYLWTYDVISYTDGSLPTVTPKSVVGVYGKDGIQGDSAEFDRLAVVNEKTIVSSEGVLEIDLTYKIEHVKGSAVTNIDTKNGYTVRYRGDTGTPATTNMSSGVQPSVKYSMSDYYTNAKRPSAIIVELLKGSTVVDMRSVPVVYDSYAAVTTNRKLGSITTTVAGHTDTLNGQANKLTQLEVGLKGVKSSVQTMEGNLTKYSTIEQTDSKVSIAVGEAERGDINILQGTAFTSIDSIAHTRNNTILTSYASVSLNNGSLWWGNRNVLIIHTSGLTKVQHEGWKQFIPFENDTDYTLSVYAKRVGTLDADGCGYIEIISYDADFTHPVWLKTQAIQTPNDDEWRQQIVNFHTRTDKALVCVFMYVHQNGELCFYQPMLTRGHYEMNPPKWTPSPYDTIAGTLLPSGFDVSKGRIDMRADNFSLENNEGEKTLSVNKEGDLEMKGVVKANALYRAFVTTAPTDYYVAYNQDGTIQAKKLPPDIIACPGGDSKGSPGILPYPGDVVGRMVDIYGGGFRGMLDTDYSSVYPSSWYTWDTRVQEPADPTYGTALKFYAVGSFDFYGIRLNKYDIQRHQTAHCKLLAVHEREGVDYWLILEMENCTPITSPI